MSDLNYKKGQVIYVVETCNGTRLMNEKDFSEWKSQAIYESNPEDIEVYRATIDASYVMGLELVEQEQKDD